MAAERGIDIPSERQGQNAPGGRLEVPTIRTMVESDIGWAVALEERIFADAWTVTMVLEEVINDTRRYFLAEIDGHPVGYAGLWIQPDNAEIMTIGVDPARRGQGIGKALLDALIAEARAAWSIAILLEVRADNPSAQRLYDRAGFTKIGIRKKYYASDGCDAIVMRLELATSLDGSVIS